MRVLQEQSREYAGQVHRALLHEWETYGYPQGELKRKKVRDEAKRIAKKMFLDLPPEYYEAITEDVVDSVLGLGIIEPFMRDPTVTEIMVNGVDGIFVERDGSIEKTNARFGSDEEIMSLISHIVGKVGRRIDEANPYVDARLPDGSRINATIPPIALNGPTLTIRRFGKTPFSLDLLVGKESLTAGMADFLRAAVVSKRNILISGGTGTGKTSALNALAQCVPENERLITIEDAAELRIDHPHVVGMEARSANVEGRGEIPIRLLVKNALRMRPDRIIVGETRGGEALDMLQAMNTGHEGSLTTVHANSAREALYRLETMALMADIELPLHAIRAQIESAIHIIIQLERLPCGARKIVSVHEVVRTPDREGMELLPLFEYDKLNKLFKSSGRLPAMLDLYTQYGVELQLDWFIV